MENLTFTDDFVKEQGFTPEQVTAITTNVTGQYEPHIAELKKEWGDTAVTNAENIISDAIKATQTASNFTLEREQGEKLKDWQVRYSTALNATSIADLASSKKEYDDKVANFKGDADLKAKIIVLEDKLTPLQKQEAEYVKLLNSGIVDEHKSLLASNKDNLRALAFGSAKPTFHKDANEFEVGVKWDKFILSVEETHDVVMVGKEAIAILKTNEHIRVPLKDLVKGNEDLTKLIDGRQQDPLNPDPADAVTVTGVPFAVPKDVSNKDLTALIHKQLAIENLEKTGHTAAEYSKRFKELNELARGKKTSDKD